MDVSIINPFIEAVLKVMQTSSNLEGRTRAPYIKEDDIAPGEVTGCLILSGDPGILLSLSFSASCILTAVSRMFGEELKEIDDDILDAVGEMMNQVCGQANNSLALAGIKRKASFDKVLSGKDHKIEYRSSGPVLLVPLDTESGPFFMEVLFEE